MTQLSAMSDTLATRVSTVVALGRRLEDAGPLAETLSLLKQVRQVSSLALPVAVRDARGAGLSWAEIADALGTTRQSAWQTYSTTAPPRGKVKPSRTGGREG